jgi:hypothetical protein
MALCQQLAERLGNPAIPAVFELVDCRTQRCIELIPNLHQINRCWYPLHMIWVGH